MDKANCSGIEFYVCLRKRVELSVASFDHVKDDQFMSSKIMIPLTSPPSPVHTAHPQHSRCSIINIWIQEQVQSN